MQFCNIVNDLVNSNFHYR